ncbi:MAG: proton-conducting transporter membrane subunit [Planctomycetaceae bacterium]
MNEQLVQIAPTLKWLLFAAWIVPLAGFTVEVFGGWWGDRKSKAAAYLAVVCIATGFVLSSIALCQWVSVVHPFGGHDTHTAADAHADPAHGAGDHDHDHGGDHARAHGDAHHGNDPYKGAVSGTFYTLATFGGLQLSIDYYIDGLTLVMFCMVTLIATCIHVFAIGYMSEELTEDYEDHQVHLSGGRHFHRPGRFYRFFSFLSLFCFAMLGLVLAGNIFQVFIFWELVGVCSYFLIGFYVERHSASTAPTRRSS